MLKIFDLNSKDITLESIASHNHLRAGNDINKISILFKKVEKKDD